MKTFDKSLWLTFPVFKKLVNVESPALTVELLLLLPSIVPKTLDTIPPIPLELLPVLPVIASYP